MGVITKISLDEVNIKFKLYDFIELKPTYSGIVDTTYIASTAKESYILKRYERAKESKIISDAKLLDILKSNYLNVATLVDSSDGWYLYSMVQGVEPKVIKSYHIESLARFLAKFHTTTSTLTSNVDFLYKNEIEKMLNFVKLNFYAYYKKLEHLKYYNMRSDGIIHGDIFKDNTLFYDNKIAVIDFIDSGNGEFLFDIAVALVAFDAQREFYINLFVKIYNQNTINKIKVPKLKYMLRVASHYYALLCIYRYKRTKKAMELI